MHTGEERMQLPCIGGFLLETLPKESLNRVASPHVLPCSKPYLQVMTSAGREPLPKAPSDALLS